MVPTEQTLNDFISRPHPCALKTVMGIDGDILVLGAAGKMGLHLCLMLRKCIRQNGQHNRVIAVSRFSSPGSKDQFEAYGIETIACDLSDQTELANLPDCSHIWFMAGVKFGTQDNPDLLRQLNIEMPEKVAQRFRHSRITALSTGCVYPFVPIGSGGASEAVPPAPVGAYATSCLGRENAFRKVSLEEGLRAVLVRLNYSVETQYGVLVDIATKVMNQEPIDVSMGYFNCIWQGDAIAHIIASISLAESPPVILNVSGLDVLSTRETAIKFGQLLGIKPIFTGQEQQTAWLNNASKATHLFGPPQVSPDQIIAWIAQWLANGGKILGKPTKFEVRSGNF